MRCHYIGYARGWTSWGSFSGMDYRFCTSPECPYRSQGPPLFFPWGYVGGGVKSTTFPRLKLEVKYICFHCVPSWCGRWQVYHFIFYHRKSRLSGTLFSGTFDLMACVSVQFIAPKVLPLLLISTLRVIISACSFLGGSKRSAVPIFYCLLCFVYKFFIYLYIVPYLKFLPSHHSIGNFALSAWLFRNHAR